MNRLVLAFRYFFNILAHGEPLETAISASPATEQPAATPSTRSDGALQMLSILQRDSRLLDFLMEDVSAYSDGQIGAAARVLHDQCRDAVSRYLKLEPVLDGVEGAFTRVPSENPALVKFVGNVPAQPPSGGVLRHKGWRAANVDLPPVVGAADVSVLAPAEIEIE